MTLAEIDFRRVREQLFDVLRVVLIINYIHI